jgi:hypothetical protein
VYSFILTFMELFLLYLFWNIWTYKMYVCCKTSLIWGFFFFYIKDSLFCLRIPIQFHISVMEFWYVCFSTHHCSIDPCKDLITNHGKHFTTYMYFQSLYQLYI